MNKEQPKQFSFLFPVIDSKSNKKITELQVIGCIEPGRLKEALDYKILKINHFATGESVSSDIKTFLYYTNRHLYDQVLDAALNHATEKFGLKKHRLLTM